MDTLDPLYDDLRTSHPDLPLWKELIDEDHCIELHLGRTQFLLSYLRQWSAGIVVHADLGQPQDESRLMRQALRLNTGQATRQEPIYALTDAGLVCRYRLPFADAHAGSLVERLQQVARQHQAWLDAGWLTLATEEACA